MIFIKWLLASSENPKKYSLTIKSVLVGAVSILAILNFDTSSLPQTVDFIVDALEKTLVAVSAVTALVGVVRKVRLTRKLGGMRAVVERN